MAVMRRRWITLIVIAALVALAGARAWTSRDAARFERVRGAVAGAGGVSLAATTYVPEGVGAAHQAPAVLIAHGLGATRASVAQTARALARRGYLVRTWDARGVGDSEGRVSVAARGGEVADVSALIDEIAEREDVLLDAAGDPRVAVIGLSHGGGTVLLAAERDHRIDAVVSIFAWSDLVEALEPNAAQPVGRLPYTAEDPGVLKVRWASELFASGSGSARRPDPCGNIERELCAAWTKSVRAGSFTAAARALLRERSPLSFARDLRAPTLIVQGQFDSLFGFEHALQLEQQLRATSTPSRVEWLRAGHDLELTEQGRVHLEQAIVRWLDHFVRKERGVIVGPRLTVELGSGRGYAHAPTMDGAARDRSFELRPVPSQDESGRVRLAAPPGGLPADTTTLPGLGNVSGFGSLDPPKGQRARFETAPALDGIEVIGAARVYLSVTGTQREAVLFVRLVDIASDGRRLIPRALIAPVRVRDVPPLDAAQGRVILVRLPYIAWRLAPGHRFAIEIASTDAGYVANQASAIFSVEVPDERGLTLPIAAAPRRTAETFDAGIDDRDLLFAAALLIVSALGIALGVGRVATVRAARVQEPRHRNDPVVARGLGKRFPEGVTAVDDASFEVLPGSIVGLVGPNGAGKTTILRMLLGLVHPSHGTAHLFGQRVRPGAPSLARVGALIEGPGLIPDRTGRAHLERYWSATGRPRAQSGIEDALAEVDMTVDAGRLVRTYSHGMRQRLAIAQALLGKPDLVVLDEPTNGLDPGQIRHLRNVIRAVALDGRAVLVSSHLLGELEQFCTHVVLMAHGRVLASGTLAHVRGEHATLEESFLQHVEACDAG